MVMDCRLMFASTKYGDSGCARMTILNVLRQNGDDAEARMTIDSATLLFGVSVFR